MTYSDLMLTVLCNFSQYPSWLWGSRAVGILCCLLGIYLKILREDSVALRILYGLVSYPCLTYAAEQWLAVVIELHPQTLKGNFKPGRARKPGPGRVGPLNGNNYWHPPHWTPSDDPRLSVQAKPTNLIKSKVWFCGEYCCLLNSEVVVSVPCSPKPEISGGVFKFC